MTEIRIAACLRSNDVDFPCTIDTIENVQSSVDAVHVLGNLSKEHENELRQHNVNYFGFAGKDIAEERNKLLSMAPTAKWLLFFDTNEVPTQDLVGFVEVVRDDYKTKVYDSIWFRECVSSNWHISQPNFPALPNLFNNIRNPYFLKNGVVSIREGMFRRSVKLHHVYVKYVGESR